MKRRKMEKKFGIKRLREHDHDYNYSQSRTKYYHGFPVDNKKKWYTEEEYIEFYFLYFY